MRDGTVAVAVNGRAVALLGGTVDGDPPLDRASIVSARIQALLDSGVRPGEITAAPQLAGGESENWAVRARGEIVVLAAPGDELPDGSAASPESLSRRWAALLRRALRGGVAGREASSATPRASRLASAPPKPATPAKPPLFVSRARVIVPVGETRAVLVGGTLAGSALQALDGDPRVASSSYDRATRRLTIAGLTAGASATTLTAALPTPDAPPRPPPPGGQAGASAPTGVAPAAAATVVAGAGASTRPAAVAPAAASVPMPAAPDVVTSGMAQVSVVVENYAARVPGNVTVTVSGEPFAPASLVLQALAYGFGRAVQTQPGAALEPVTLATNAPALVSGRKTTFVAPVAAQGAGVLPVQTQASVTIVNAPAPDLPVAALLYSNDPEVVKAPGTLLVGRLIAGRTVRLDYHHQNRSGGALWFHPDLINDSDTDATVYVADGVSLPAADTFQVGRKAGVAFMTALGDGDGMTIDVPPRSLVPLLVQRLPDGQTVSGIAQCTQLTGPAGGVAVRVACDASPLALPPASVAATSAAALPPTALTAAALPLPPGALAPPSPNVYLAPEIELTAEYAVGGPWSYLRIGRTQLLQDAAGRRVLAGNYGASYTIRYRLTNPTHDERPVVLEFAPEAGYAAGVFQIDGGPLLDFPPTLPGDDRRLTRLTLEPRETRTIVVRTLALNGSFYPVSIIAHAL